MIPDPPEKTVSPDEWHVTCDTKYEKNASVNQWFNDKGVCKTAMAKPGLFKLICGAIFMKVVRFVVYLVILLLSDKLGDMWHRTCDI